MAKDLPKVLVLGPPTCFSTFEQLYSHKFNLLNPKPSGLPLQQFMLANHHNPSTISAIFCSALYRISVDVLSLLPSLRLVVSSSAGTDHINLHECRRRGIQVAGAGGVFSEDVADAAVALLIDVMRKITAADRYLRMRQNNSDPWNFTLGHRLSGKRVGIVGLGNIGMEVAKRLESFNCFIMYNSKHKKQSISYPFYSNVVDLATSSDALVVCCALNNQTRHIINRDVLLALGKEGFIVNVGRGGLIDEKELLRCLIEGEIGGAGLDVFENEPHVPKEFFSLDNVVLSPHSGAFTVEATLKLCEVVAENLEAFFLNKALITPVMLGPPRVTKKDIGATFSRFHIN
ncbi:glyoxylate/hydroxypyruvate reductase HPR3-like [Vicia villosa]|uniref:glyoxylate/hydroxypyruvate reductase HPR3-like n=1 Tax=Vicia villosa TaxID=3911 RepID=UPI00273AAE08|nr:glyoxylate/hydroxypyruvate reductase HPR3-like [Vicia villosa]